MKRREVLEKMTESILQKNHNVYLQHEVMLDEEKQKRVELAASFQSRMEEVTAKVNEMKVVRQQEVEANNEIREKIKAQVSEYKEAEQKYKKQMAAY